jgi:hypothetical protein
MHHSSIIRTPVLSHRRLLSALALVSLLSHTLFSDALLIPPLHTNSARMGLQFVLFSHHLRTDRPGSQQRSTLSSALIALLNDQYSFVLSALVAGLIANLLVWRLNPARTPPAALCMFALVVPIVFYSLFFSILSVTKGNGWSIGLNRPGGYYQPAAQLLTGASAGWCEGNES